MKPCIEHQGYRTKKGYGRQSYKNKTVASHRLAFFLANGWWPPEVGHICNNPPCKEPTHLYATTTLDNNRYKTALGRQAHHETHGMVKLTRAQVDEIRARHAAGEAQRPLARAFGVSQAQVSNIVLEKHWV